MPESFGSEREELCVELPFLVAYIPKERKIRVEILVPDAGRSTCEEGEPSELRGKRREY